MKKTLYMAIIGIAVVLMSSCSHVDNLPEWAKRLNEILIPDYMQGNTQVDVYFKYNQLVNGYEVTAKWMPYDRFSETGVVVMNFLNKNTGMEFQYFGEKYQSSDTDEISFAKDFNGHKSGDVHYFNYTSPDTLDHFKEINGNSPLGYYTPFQFLDIDFDGKDELLMSDWNRGKAGNDYTVFKLSENGLQKIDYIPLDRLTNVDRIDLKNESLTIVECDGASDRAEFYYSHKERKEGIIDAPEFHSVSARRLNVEMYNKELGSPFVLDSIKENTVSADGEYRTTYIVIGSKIVKV